MAEAIELGDIPKKKKPVKKKKILKKVSNKEDTIRKRPSAESLSKKKKKKKPSSSISDIDDVIKKKKKKKRKPVTQGELMVRAEAKSEAIKGMDGIIEQIENERPQVKENAQFQEYVTMFETLKSIARVKEGHCLKGADSKDIYALMQVYNQMRDIIADLRALKDITMAAEDLEANVMQPFGQQSAAALMKFFQSVKNQAQKDLSDDKLITFLNQTKKFAKESGLDLQDALDNASDSIFRVLSEQ